MKKILLSILFAFSMIFAAFGCSSIDVANEPANGDNTQLEATEQTSNLEESDTEESLDFDSQDDALDSSNSSDEQQENSDTTTIDIDGSYTSKDEVALYIHTYNQLPNNFITKKMANKLGWSGGSLEPYAPGKSIGGDHFGNYEGLLPKKAGRTYTECDIDTMYADKRGAKRIIFSNDGLIYYTDDHYETFTLLYGEE